MQPRTEQVAEEEDWEAFGNSAHALAEEIAAEWEASGWLSKLETANGRWLVGWSVFSNVNILSRQSMQNQLATLAVGVRLYQHRYGEWPQQLDQLRTVGLDPDAWNPK